MLNEVSDAELIKRYCLDCADRYSLCHQSSDRSVTVTKKSHPLTTKHNSQIVSALLLSGQGSVDAELVFLASKVVLPDEVKL